MALSASIKFSQGALTPPAGQALIGVLGSAVNVENGDDSDVAHWSRFMMEVPPGSSVPLGAFGGDSPTATFTPDVAGRCYRVKLVVEDADGNTLTDIRNFGVLDERGLLMPSFVPVVDDAGAPVRDYSEDEFNFDGQARSWAHLMDSAAEAALRWGNPNVLVLDTAATPAGRVFSSWSKLCAALAARFTRGEVPRIVFAASATLPLTGMPSDGWDMRYAVWEAAPGADVTVTCPDGFKLDRWSGATGDGLLVTFAPSTEYNALNWTDRPVAGAKPRVVRCDRGAAIRNLGTKAVWVSPGDGAHPVLCSVFVDGGGKLGFGGAAGPFLKVVADDSLSASHTDCGSASGLGDGWVVGGAGAGTFTIFEDASSRDPAVAPGPFTTHYPSGWVGSFAGGTRDRAAKVFYSDAAASPRTGASTVQGAIDWLKARANPTASTVGYDDSVVPDYTFGNFVQDALDFIKAWMAGLNGGAVAYDDSAVPSPALGTNNVQGALDAIKPLLGGGGSAIDPDAVYFHIVRRVRESFAPSFPVGSYTVGTRAVLYKAFRIAGLRVYTAQSGSHTIKLSAWISTTLVCQEDFTVSGPGEYVKRFATPYDMVDADLGEDLTMGMWETTGAGYTKSITAPDAAYVDKMGGPYLFWKNADFFIGGNARPNFGAGTETYLVEPILEAIP